MEVTPPGSCWTVVWGAVGAVGVTPPLPGPLEPTASEDGVVVPGAWIDAPGLDPPVLSVGAVGRMAAVSPGRFPVPFPEPAVSPGRLTV